jgi:hypothetical protein
MKGPVIHGALLVVALVLAYQSWTRDKTEEKKLGNVKVWTKSDLQKVTFVTKDKTLVVERRNEGGDRYLWGSETRESKVRKQPPGDTSGQPEFEIKQNVKEFPVGDSGEDLFKNLAELRALRDLGALEDDAMERYGITDSTEEITVTFADGDRSLTLGGKIYGGTDRYVLDKTSGRGYAIAGTIVAPLTGGESSLRLSKLFKFEEDKVENVAVSAGGKDLKLVRTETEDENTKVKKKGWANAATPDKPDQTLSNFLDNLKGLRPTAYVAEIEGPALEPVMTAEWHDKSGKSLGKLEVWKQTLPPPPEPPAPPAPPPTVPPTGTPPAPAGTPTKPAAPTPVKPAAPTPIKPAAPTKPTDPATHDPAGGDAKQPVAVPPPPPAKPGPTAPAKPGPTAPAKPGATPVKPGAAGAPPPAPGAKPGPTGAPVPPAPDVLEPPKPREPQVEYYVKTELTRIYGKIGKGPGDRIEKDLKEILK